MNGISEERRAGGRRPLVPGGLKALVVLVRPDQREALEKQAREDGSTLGAAAREVLDRGLLAEAGR